MGIKCLETVFKIRDPILNATQIPGNSDTLSLLKMGKLTDIPLSAYVAGHLTPLLFYLS